ncbi:WD40 repeat-like protein [Suillus hirtellus]|nr:WD40 repeat-like protein [Suillus hirtellus]
MAQHILNPTPVRVFNTITHVSTVAVFPDRRRMVTGLYGKIVLWDMVEAVVLKEMEGHNKPVSALAVSQDGQMIASGGLDGEVIAWDADIGEPLTNPIKAHTYVHSLDFSPDGSMLATGSIHDKTSLLISTKTWELLVGHSITCADGVHCVRYSPSGELLAIATSSNIKIYNTSTRECVVYFEAHCPAYNSSLAWTPDGTRLFSAGTHPDPNIREWDSSTWKQVGIPWKGHFNGINAISLNSSGTLLASASEDRCVRLWRLSDRRTIVSFKHSSAVSCVTFSPDDRHIISGSERTISEWPLPENTIPKDSPKGGPKDVFVEQTAHQAQAYSDFKVLSMSPTVRVACIACDLPTAEKALNGEIVADPKNHISYANRAFIMARKSDWNRALLDSIKSVSIRPSFAGHVSKGVALCGKGQIRAANTAFDLASVFTNGDLKTSHFLFLIKTVSLFRAGEHEEAMLRVGELVVSPDVDPVACRIVETYLRVRLGVTASENAHYSEAIDHFNAAINASASFHQLEIHSTYEEFTLLFGWNLKNLWQDANQQLCKALIQAGRIGAAIEAFQSLMGKSDEAMKPSLRAWFSDLQ